MPTPAKCVRVGRAGAADMPAVGVRVEPDPPAGGGQCGAVQISTSDSEIRAIMTRNVTLGLAGRRLVKVIPDQWWHECRYVWHGAGYRVTDYARVGVHRAAVAVGGAPETPAGFVVVPVCMLHPGMLT